MQIIHNWLKGNRNFLAGSILYKTFGDNQALKDLLEKGETPFAKKQLTEALEKLGAPGEVVTLHAPPVARETEAMPDSEDAILTAIKNEWQPLYQRMNLLRHELDRYGASNSDEAIAWRKVRSKEIKQLDKQCNAIWAKRDYYIKEGKLPFIPAKPSDPIELANQLNNIKKNIRRNRTLMKEKPGEPQYAQYYQDWKYQYLQITGYEYNEKN